MRLARNVLFASTIIAGLAAAAPSFAQPVARPDRATPPVSAVSAADIATQNTAVGELIVTGSRIKRSNFSTPSPIQVITSEQSELVGAVDTTQILQHATVANNATQINNFFTGFITTGGPGVNTLSLRGLGAQRTLFLINGRRLGPAGVGGTVGPVDLNTIPSSDIDHVEILKDGASSVYGSDAIAGVVNVITKKSIDGGELHIFAGPSEHGGGNQYEVNGIWGKTWDRGYFNIGFDIFRQDALRYGQRGYFACATQNVVDATTGAPADIIDPATGRPKCFNIFAPDIEDLGRGGRIFAVDPTAVAGGGFRNRDLNGFKAVAVVVPGDPAATRLSRGQEPFDDPKYAQSTAISPVTRYTITGFAGYDLTAHAHLYGELLLNRRDSSQTAVSQFFTVVNGGNPFNPGRQFFLPLPIIPQFSPSSQSVDYGRVVIGINGDAPSMAWFKNWTYDLYGQFSHSAGYYSRRFNFNDRVNATAGAGAGTNGCNVNAIAPGGSGQTMAQREPGVACVPVDYFRALTTGFTDAETAFLYGVGNGRTIYNHYYVEGTLTGDLFTLPAGPVGASLGFQVRREELDDSPARDFAEQNAFHVTTAGRTRGADSIQEIFGEVALPILKDQLWTQALNFTASGRWSHYKSYGSNATYKLGVDWKINDWLLFRASRGTAFRAPALYELFLANQTGFLSQLSVDPCINYGNSGVSQNIQKNCASLGFAPDFIGGGSSATILTGGGVGNLKPETSVSKTVGVVFTPKWFGLDLSIAADYYDFNIKNQIRQFGAGNIVSQCFNSPSFPNDPFCTLFTRNNDPASTNFRGIDVVKNNYVNVAQEIDQGLDVELRYRMNLPRDIKFTLDSELAWTFYTNVVLLNGSGRNFLGQVGQPAFVGNLNVRFDRGPWTLNYFVDFVGHSSDDKFVSNINPNYFSTGQAVFLNHVVPFYTISSISIRRKLHDLILEVGVKNLLDTKPPVYSTGGFQNRIGTFPLSSQYDVVGRSYFVDVTKKF